MKEGCEHEPTAAVIIVIIPLKISSVEVWLRVICSAILSVPLLNVENGIKRSASDDGLHPKVQPSLRKGGHAVEQRV